MDYWKNNDEFNNYEEEDKLFEEEFDELTLEKENNLYKQLDPDLIEYFNDARIIKRKTNFKSKKNKKDKIVYNVGEKVSINNEICTILYGPYEKDNKVYYEIENSKENVLAVEEKNIKNII